MRKSACRKAQARTEHSASWQARDHPGLIKRVFNENIQEDIQKGIQRVANVAAGYQARCRLIN